MSSSRIEELKKQRQKEINLKKNQKKYFYIVATIAFIIFLFLLKKDFKSGFIWSIGIIIGLVMQRSRFCFAASFRDPIMVGSTSLFRAVIIGLVVATIGFSLIQYNRIEDINNYTIEDVPGNIEPVGLHTAIGAIIFGIGMVIAGGCVSGSLIRIGEGSLMQLVSLIGIIIGATVASYQFEFWDLYFISKTREIYLPKIMGFFPTVIIQLIVLLILYYIAKKYDDKNNIMANM